MASAHNQAPSTDLFDAYFQQADLNRDGRISGVEAVSFFNGSGLSKQVLAQIWALADQRQIGFLGRSEFYNALKLVTVAQKKRELTPEIVKAALYGPHAAKIPAPQINVTAMPAYQLNSTPVATSLQIATSTPTSSQNPGFGGQLVPPSVSVNPQQASFQASQLLKSPQSASETKSTPFQLIGPQGLPEGGSVGRNSSPSTSISLDQIGGGGGVQGITAQFPANRVGPTSQVGFGASKSGPTASLPPRPQPSGIRPLGPQSKDSKVMSISGNGVASNSFFGEDVFSATPPLRQDSSSGGISSVNVPGSSGKHPSVRPSIDSSGSLLPKKPDGGQFEQSEVVFRSHQQGLTNASSSGISLGSDISIFSQSPHPWPRMTPNDVQKYTKVFIEVDKDRDGKITGGEARNLFLSWRLPREILKQVWDLSDQDNDSMLSLKEFCIALYLMERYREGRPLPAVVPSDIVSDFPNSTPPTTDYNSAAWGPGSGFQQQKGISGSNTHSTPDSGVTVTPSMPPPIPKIDEGLQISEQKSRVPVLEKHLVNQLSTEEQNSLNTKFQEATDAEKKVEELEKQIFESKEKIEFYRAKMQELILHKSRCDNRLNEITERVSADKREVESLAKKYEEKYKQIGDVASKLTIEEATFRDIQERKLDLYQAIVKMEQDGNEDSIIRVHADRIQSDLDELVKILNERCKSYGLRTKPTTLTELPFGWQPGIQESSADWDEEWDKFTDEGFTFVKELTLDVQNVLAPPKQKSISVQKEQNVLVGSPGIADSSDTEPNLEKLRCADEAAVVNGTKNNNKSENESVKSVPSSPIGSNAAESPREFSDSNFTKTSGFDVSPRNKEIRRDHGGVGSPLFVDQSFDEPTWGSFDTNDDTDSVWGFNTVNTTKDFGHDNINKENYFTQSGDFGLNPIKTGVSQSSVYGQKKSGFSFDESVPSTPLFSSGNSPQGYGHNFDSFSRFDSFRMQDSGLFTQQETLARFDSVRSSKDFDYGQRFQSFDDSDPFGSSGLFRTSQENQTPKRGSDSWSAF